jgi:hypothetical protein
MEAALIIDELWLLNHLQYNLTLQLELELNYLNII